MVCYCADKLTAAMLHMQAAERHKAVGINHNPFDVFDCEVRPRYLCGPNHKLLDCLNPLPRLCVLFAQVGEAVLNVEHEKVRSYGICRGAHRGNTVTDESRCT